MSAEEMGTIIDYGDEDLNDATAPEPLPDGEYPAEVQGSELHTSQTSGKGSVKVTFVIKPEDFPPDYIDAAAYPEGKTVAFYVSREADRPSRFRMKQFCENIGAPLGTQLDINDWVGKQAKIALKSEEYEGVSRERVTRVLGD
jgi:hypothetical protein